MFNEPSQQYVPPLPNLPNEPTPPPMFGESKARDTRKKPKPMTPTFLGGELSTMGQPNFGGKQLMGQ